MRACVCFLPVYVALDVRNKAAQEGKDRVGTGRACVARVPAWQSQTLPIHADFPAAAILFAFTSFHHLLPPLLHTPLVTTLPPPTTSLCNFMHVTPPFPR